MEFIKDPAHKTAIMQIRFNIVRLHYNSTEQEKKPSNLKLDPSLSDEIIIG